jgi:hypothetical protein
MAKTDKDWRLKIGKLKAKVEKLRARLDERGSASAPAAKVKAANPVSPLAPAPVLRSSSTPAIPTPSPASWAMRPLPPSPAPLRTALGMPAYRASSPPRPA